MSSLKHVSGKRIRFLHLTLDLFLFIVTRTPNNKRPLKNNLCTHETAIIFRLFSHKIYLKFIKIQHVVNSFKCIYKEKHYVINMLNKTYCIDLSLAITS